MWEITIADLNMSLSCCAVFVFPYTLRKVCHEQQRHPAGRRRLRLAISYLLVVKIERECVYIYTYKHLSHIFALVNFKT